MDSKTYFHLHLNLMCLFQNNFKMCFLHLAFNVFEQSDCDIIKALMQSVIWM